MKQPPSSQNLIQRITQLCDAGNGGDSCILRSQTGRTWLVRSASRQDDLIMVHGEAEPCQYNEVMEAEFSLPLDYFLDYMKVTGVAIEIHDMDMGLAIYTTD